MNKKTVFQSDLFILILLFVFFPVGLILMWRERAFTKGVRIFFSTVGSIIFVTIFVSNFSSDQSEIGEDKSQIEQGQSIEETQEISESESSDESEDTSDSEENNQLTRDNSTARETDLNSGKFIGGQDVPVGRYVITASNSGNFFIKGDIPINEILDPTEEFGVKSVTTQINEGLEIEISGINSVNFKPAVTEKMNKLTPGYWQVGLDIAEGRYDVTPSGTGNFFVYSDVGNNVNEILDESGENGIQKYSLNISNGDIIYISSINKVRFKEK